ncbi:MAG: MFS transporter [Helicobacter sp.]|nr:MFS transporter [Helicobacter sp.]
MSKKSLFIASFSTVVEWYDFTLYLFFASVISKVFFGDNPHSIILTLFGFALAYFMRPLGAIFFAHIGDRFGRKITLMTTISIMFVATLLTALLPTFSQIGIYSGILMIILRMVMAFSVGGEYISIVTYLLESAPKKRQGLMASLAPGFSEVGALLAVFTSALSAHFFNEADLLSYGWRMPFLIGSALALIIFISRSQMAESKEFIKVQKLDRPLIWTLKHFKKQIAKTFSVSALGSISYYVGIGFVPVFLSMTAGFSQSTALWISTAASFAVIIITPFFGALGDYFGQKRVLIGLAILNAILPIGAFYLMSGSGIFLALLGAITLAIIAAGVSAVAASATPLQFETKNRLSGLSLGVTVATSIFGGLTPLLAQYLTDLSGLSYAPGIMIAIVGLAVIPIFMTLKQPKLA